jgi:hypothetical protein
MQFKKGEYIIVNSKSFIEYAEFEYLPLEVLDVWEVENDEPAYETIGRNNLNVYRLHSTIDIEKSIEYNKNRKREEKLKRILMVN